MVAVQRDNRRRVVDLFAGGGGVSLGVKKATGHSPVVAVNHWNLAIEVHRRNHPETRHFVADVYKVKPEEVAAMGDVWLLWASPDCFPAGTMILTREGYRPVEQIAVGDEVLTHRNRWRKVTATMNAARRLVCIHAANHANLEVSTEHPFYARTIQDGELSAPGWVRAGDLGPQHLLASPIKLPDGGPVPWCPKARGNGGRIDGDMLWSAVNEVVDLEWTDEVFNLSVEEDESYVAEGFIVHNCTHHSVAKGGKPVQQKIRMLPFSVIPWAAKVKPVMIIVENVQELRRWGPLKKGKDGKMRPDPARAGEIFRAWVRKLERLGYAVEHRVLCAADYGVPTSRRRLFVIARRDGEPIVWPEPTHGSPKACAANPKLLPWRTAAECIDWSIPTPSIFDRRTKTGKPKPLKPKTLWRIFKGLQKFVLENPNPFIVPFIAGAGGRAGQSPATSTDQPLGTVTAKNDRGIVTPVLTRYNTDERGRSQAVIDPLTTIDTSNRFGLVMPSLVEMNHQNAPHPVTDPLGTVTTQDNRFNLLAPVLERASSPEHEPIVPGGRFTRAAVEEFFEQVTAPHLVKVNHGGKSRREARGEQLNLPLSTVTAGRRGHALVAPILARTAHGDVDRNGKRRGQGAHTVEEPLPTATATKDIGVVAPVLAAVGGPEGQGHPASVDAPLGTVLGENHRGLMAANLIAIDQQAGGGKDTSSSAEDPLHTVVTKNRSGLVTAFLAQNYGGVVGQPLGEGRPMPTVTARDHNSIAAAALVKLRGECNAADPRAPMPTLTASGNHIAEVRAFLTVYYGQDGNRGHGQELTEPMRTITAKARLGIVTVVVDGEEVDFQIIDIGFRMLRSRELLRATCGEYADEFDLSPAKTEEARVRLIGNMVPPKLPEVLIRANMPNGSRRRSAA